MVGMTVRIAILGIAWGGGVAVGVKIIEATYEKINKTIKTKIEQKQEPIKEPKEEW